MAGTYARNIALQKQLKAGGFYRGKIDGIIGPRTLAALQASQQKGAPPLPRERPDQPGDAGPIDPSLSGGGGDLGAEASGTLPLAAPDATDVLPNYDTTPLPAATPPNPAASAWINAGMNALPGSAAIPQTPAARMRAQIPDPNSLPPPARTPPGFAGNYATSGTPMDQGALQSALARLLSQSVVANRGR